MTPFCPSRPCVCAWVHSDCARVDLTGGLPRYRGARADGGLVRCFPLWTGM